MGEFRKRFLDMGYFTVDYEFLDFMKVIKEAEKDFPDTLRRHSSFEPDYIVKVIDWFEEWFK